MTALFRRELRIAFAGGGVVLPLVFFLLVATLFPFAIGPNDAVLARAGGGALWVAALLAALLPVDRLIAPDLEAGIFDQLSLRGIGEESVAAIKLLAHWLGFGPPLMLAAIPATALLRLDGATLYAIELGLLLGTPGLAALTLMTAAFTAGLRGTASLTGLLALPLAVPLLIFGAGLLTDGAGAARLLAATSLLFVAAAPFATAAAIRAARE